MNYKSIDLRHTDYIQILSAIKALTKGTVRKVDGELISGEQYKVYKPKETSPFIRVDIKLNQKI
jgi:hypothetical protein